MTERMTAKKVSHGLDMVDSQSKRTKRLHIFYWALLSCAIFLFVFVTISCFVEYHYGTSDNSGWAEVSLFVWVVNFYLPVSVVFSVIEIVLVKMKKHKAWDFVLISLLWICMILSHILIKI